MMDRDLEVEKVKAAESRFSSWEWNYGKKMEFSLELSHRFSWGTLSIQLEVKDGKVADAAAYSDALQPDIILELPDGLRQARCSKKELCAKLETLHPDTTDEQKMLQEIREWLWSVEL